MEIAACDTNFERDEKCVPKHIQRQKRYRQRRKIEKLIQFGKSEPKTNAERQKIFRENLQRKVKQDDELYSARGSTLQIIGGVVVERDNNQMEVDHKKSATGLIHKPDEIIAVGSKNAPKTSAERGREYRARKALLKQQIKQQQKQDDSRDADPSEDNQFPGLSVLRAIDKRVKSAEATRRWRERKRAVSGAPKKQAKTAAQRMKEYRERRKLKKINAERAKRYRDNIKLKKLSPLLSDPLPSTSKTINNEPTKRRKKINNDASNTLGELGTQYRAIRDTIRKILSQERNLASDETDDEATSTLDKFKRRLIQNVAESRHQEKYEEDEIWLQLEREYGCDCRLLWKQMRSLTIKKLKRLLAVGDRVDLLAPLARMTPIDWLTFDLVLAHEDVDVIGEDLKPARKSEHNVLNILFDLVQKHSIEDAPQGYLRERWQKLTEEYNECGRQCSAMLLQRRWYQLKSLTRRTFYQFWQAFQGQAPNAEKGVRLKPNKLVMDIAARYNTLVTQPFPEWKDLRDQLVTSNEAFEITSLYGTESKEKDHDFAEVIPKIETVFADSDHDEVMEGDKNSDDEEITIVKNEILDYISESKKTYTITNSENVIIPEQIEEEEECIGSYNKPIYSNDTYLPKIVNVVGNINKPELKVEIDEDFRVDQQECVTRIDENIATHYIETENATAFKDTIHSVKGQITSNNAISNNKLAFRTNEQNMPFYNKESSDKSIIKQPSSHSSKSLLYNQIQLSKNPDFNIRLKNLSVEFLSSHRNRHLLGKCKPLTVDIHKFGTKTVDERREGVTIMPTIKEENDISKCESFVPILSPTRIQSSLKNRRVQNQIVKVPARTVFPPRSAKDYNTVFQLSSKKGLQDLERIRITNKNLLTVEVSPIPIKGKMDESNPPVKLIHSNNVAANSNLPSVSSSVSLIPTDALNDMLGLLTREKNKSKPLNEVRKGYHEKIDTSNSAHDVKKQSSVDVTNTKHKRTRALEKAQKDYRLKLANKNLANDLRNQSILLLDINKTVMNPKDNSCKKINNLNSTNQVTIQNLLLSDDNKTEIKVTNALKEAGKEYCKKIINNFNLTNEVQSNPVPLVEETDSVKESSVQVKQSKELPNKTDSFLSIDKYNIPIEFDDQLTENETIAEALIENDESILGV